MFTIPVAAERIATTNTVVTVVRAPTHLRSDTMSPERLKSAEKKRWKSVDRFGASVVTSEPE
jgi:hypothetical protein